MTREKLLKYIEEAKDIITQLPEDFDVIDVSVWETSNDPLKRWRPPVMLHVFGVYDKIQAEANEWGETMVEYEMEDSSVMERYFDAGNVRVITLDFEAIT